MEFKIHHCTYVVICILIKIKFKINIYINNNYSIITNLSDHYDCHISKKLLII